MLTLQLSWRVHVQLFAHALLSRHALAQNLHGVQACVRECAAVTPRRSKTTPFPSRSVRHAVLPDEGTRGPDMGTGVENSCFH